MKTILLGNAGAGKSTLARQLIQNASVARLSLDEVAFDEGAARRPIAASVADAIRFIETHEHWIVEGCYSDILEPLLPYAEALIFLNPGIDTCVAHCRSRPWEPEKFPAPEAQEANLQNLINWVRAYETRNDEYGLKRHQALFDSFKGRKVEYRQPSEYRELND